MIAFILGVAAGALFASLLLPRATQYVLRRAIVKTFVEMAPTTPFHLHNGESFFRLITQGAPWLRRVRASDHGLSVGALRGLSG